MLSYMLPVEDKSVSHLPASPRNLTLNLKMTASPADTHGLFHMQPQPNSSLATIKESRTFIMDEDNCDENTKLLESERDRTTHLNSIIKNNSRNATTTQPLQLQLNLDNKHNNNNNVDGSGGGISDSGGGSGSGSVAGEDDGSGEELKNQLKKGKLSKVGTKSVPLKRVSFGSSKGSMVETLVFETPTPLPEHAEREFGFPPENLLDTTHIGIGGHTSYTINNNISTKGSTNYMDDSGIEMHEELERSKVRVSFFQSSQPQQVSPPESFSYYKESSYPLILDTFSTDISVDDSTMTAATSTQVSYDRQMSTDSGWDNPFRPGGDLSREADEIVNMIKGGKPITPTGEANHSITNGSAQNNSHSIENGKTVVDGATKVQVSQSQSAQNGTNSPHNGSAAAPTNGTAGSKGPTPVHQTQVSNQVVPGPVSASPVVIGDKKKKKCACCVIQ